MFFSNTKDFFFFSSKGPLCPLESYFNPWIIMRYNCGDGASLFSTGPAGISWPKGAWFSSYPFSEISFLLEAVFCVISLLNSAVSVGRGVGTELEGSVSGGKWGTRAFCEWESPLLWQVALHRSDLCLCVHTHTRVCTHMHTHIHMIAVLLVSWCAEVHFTMATPLPEPENNKGSWEEKSQGVSGRVSAFDKPKQS